MVPILGKTHPGALIAGIPKAPGAFPGSPIPLFNHSSGPAAETLPALIDWDLSPDFLPEHNQAWMGRFFFFFLAGDN